MASLFRHLLWMLLLQFPLLASAQNHQTIPLESSLSALDDNPSWNSPSGEFSFGFLGTGGDLFLLAIWFSKIPLKTIVWTANAGNPVQKGSVVKLTTDGDLFLSNPGGTVIWRALNGTQIASRAAMLDSGNFVLTSTNSTIIWATFDNPTDTILPTQKLDLGGMLIARISQENYTSGRFDLILQEDRNLVLYPRPHRNGPHSDAYWASNTQFHGSELVFDQYGYIYLTLDNGSPLNLTSGTPHSTKDFYHRATLDFDGVFRQYTYPRFTSSDGWSFAWSIPEDICSLEFKDVRNGYCGINSYCKLTDRRPTCECPPGYSYFDPNNTYRGCQQKFGPQSCETDKARGAVGYKMELIPNMDWSTADYASFDSVTKDWCSETCLSDCLCAAAITGEGKCRLKKFPLFNGRLHLSSKEDTHIKVGKSSETNARPAVHHQNKKARKKWVLAGSILLGCSAFLNFVFLSLIFISIYCSYRRRQLQKMPDTGIFGVNLRSFTYKELEQATDGFKDELGHGALSVVYKGRLQSVTESFVAVKRLDKLTSEVEKEFRTEVSSIGRTNHKNLVKLLGFCDEGINRLLVYEYMRNGSLADMLFGNSRPDWDLRIQIAFGIARGLAYLHEECSSQIIHCDVKPQNILLDDSFIARISDFGFAKLLLSNQSRTSTAVRGTRGYVAPEWFRNMPITTKADVYSYGVVLLEIICCRKNIILEAGGEEIDLLSDWAYECCLERKVHLLVKNDEEARKDHRLERLVLVSIWSMQENPSSRPSMKKVLQMLQGSVDVPMPPYPIFSNRTDSISVLMGSGS